MMRIFSVGIDEETIKFLEEEGIATFPDSVNSTPFELRTLVRVGNCEAGVINLDLTNWGIEAVRLLRDNRIATPVIGISGWTDAHSWSKKRAEFLEKGGDDLLFAPANHRELAASLQAAVRRSRGFCSNLVEFRHGEAVMTIDFIHGTIRIGDMEVLLPKKLNDILVCLASRFGRCQTKESLLEGAYMPYEDAPEPETIDVHIHNLRKRLRTVSPDAGKMIKTIPGHGYAFVSESRRHANVLH